MTRASHVADSDNKGFGFGEIETSCQSSLRGIYAIKCKESDRIYVGQGIDLKRRFLDHRRELRKGVHINTIL